MVARRYKNDDERRLASNTRRRQRYAVDPEYRDKQLVQCHTSYARHALARNATCREYSRRDPAATKDRQIWAQRKMKYGITKAEWETLFDSQDKRCGICGRDTPIGKTNWATDHNHFTHKVRGILCYKCNTDLRVLEDTLHRERLEAYLEKHNAED